MEALARSGVGELTLIDRDIYGESNINRQLIADSTVLGKTKTEVALEKWRSIAPDSNIRVINAFYSEENPIPLDEYDYILDCIDSVSSKLFLIVLSSKRLDSV